MNLGVPTPELDRQREALEPRPVNDVLTEFVDWLTGQGLLIAKYGRRGERKVKCPICRGRGFDADKLTPRQAQLLAKGLLSDADRERCEACRADPGYVWEEYVDDDSLQPHHERWGSLFARFLGLDEEAIESERRAILEALRA